MSPPAVIWRRLRSLWRHASGIADLSRSANRIVRRTDFSKGEKPVLLIYGFLATRRSFELMEARLRRDGYCVFTVNLGGLADAFNTRSIVETAELIARKVESLYARHPLGPLAIIGHSKGGLIGHYFVKRLGGDRRVQTLITLGTPHNGTASAYLGYPIAPLARSVLQMTPTSRFIRGLRQGPFPPSVYFASLYSREDRIARFPVARLELGGEPHLTNVEVGGGHSDLLSHRSVYAAIREQLLAGERHAGHAGHAAVEAAGAPIAARGGSR